MRQSGFHYLKGLNLQPAWPLHNLLKAPTYTSVQDGFVSIHFRLHPLSMARFNKLITDYYFEAVLLAGNILMQQDLTAMSQQSELFSFSQPPSKECSFSFLLPDQQPWMLLKSRLL